MGFPKRMVGMTTFPVTAFPVISALILSAFVHLTMAAENPMPTPPAPATTASIIVAGGCFWCVESCFEEVPGVTEAVSGYVGGTVDKPTYEAVCGGTTGHTEAVRVTYNPALVDLPKLFDVFFHVHDPTTLNRQGADHGTQYRSGIFVADAAQLTAAQAAVVAAQPRFSSPIVTEITNLAITGPARFFPAEEYHQNYFKRHPDQAYCRATIPPKLDKLRKLLQKK